MAIKLYQHNMNAYNSVEAVLEKERKACIVHPTGTGKSYIAFKLIESHPDKHFVWLGPSEYIYELQIKNLKKKQGITFSNVTFCTYAWLMHNGDEIENLKLDFIILDEFHRAGAKYWGINVLRLIEEYPDAKVFGMTATNIRYLDNRRDMANEIFEGRVCSEFDIVEAMARGYLPIPKYIVCSYYFKERLMEYEEKIAEIRSSTVRTESMQTLQKLKRAIEQAEGLDEIFYKHITKKDGRYIVFCPSMEKMYELMTKVPEWFAKVDRLPHVYCVHSYNVDSVSDFRDFQEDDSEHIKLLFTIDMLNEGIHVDGVDGVILLRTTISPIVYKQQIGRALATDTKESPIIFDMVNNFDSLYSIKEIEQQFYATKKKLEDEGEYVTYEDFKIIDELRESRRLFEVLIRNLESTWEMYYHELTIYKEEYGNVKIPKKYTTQDGLRLGQWLMRQRSQYREDKLEPEKINRLAALGVEFQNIIEANFEQWIALLEEYKAEFGNFLIPRDYVTEDGKLLCNAVNNFRSRYRKGKLSEHYIEELNRIGFVWYPYEEQWNQNYAVAEQYYKEHGNLDIGKRYITEDGTKLGLWLATQRNVYHGTVPGNLTKEQKEKLDAIHMPWDKEANYSDFDTHFQALKDYIKKNGNALVPGDYVTENGISLGYWITRLRLKNNANKIETYITAEQKNQLDEIGMIWDMHAYQWDKMYQLAKQYYEENGHLLSISSTIKSKEGESLATWIARQKDKYHQGRIITPEQIQKLEDIGIHWDLRTNRHFDKGVAAFIAYKREFQSCQVPVSYKTEDGYNLGKWCARVRTEKNTNVLSAEREAYLNELGFIWDYTDYYWEQMYQNACRYYHEHGNLNVPWDYVCDNGAKLGQWICDMRKRYKNVSGTCSEIRPDQIERLKEIGMKFADQI